MVTLHVWYWWLRAGFRSIEGRLEAYWTEVKAAGRSVAEEVLSNALAWTDEQLEHVREAKGVVLEEFKDSWNSMFRSEPPAVPRRVGVQMWLCFASEFGAWCFIGLEVLIAPVLAVIYFNAAPTLAIGIGVIVTLLIAFVFKGGVALLVARWEQLPRVALRRLGIFFVVLFPIEAALIGFVVFVAARFSSDATDAAFGILSGVLGMWTPLTAAFLFAIAGLLKWSGEDAAKWDRLTKLERRLNALKTYCLNNVASIVTSTPPAATKASPAIDPTPMSRPS